jgi:hypothetical protein
MKQGDRDPVYLEGQRHAIAIYRGLVGSEFRQKTSARQNLACCLKRVADFTGEEGDFQAFMAEVASFPVFQPIAIWLTKPSQTLSKNRSNFFGKVCWPILSCLGN